MSDHRVGDYMWELARHLKRGGTVADIRCAWIVLDHNPERTDLRQELEQQKRWRLWNKSQHRGRQEAMQARRARRRKRAKAA